MDVEIRRYSSSRTAAISALIASSLTERFVSGVVGVTSGKSVDDSVAAADSFAAVSGGTPGGAAVPPLGPARRLKSAELGHLRVTQVFD